MINLDDSNIKEVEQDKDMNYQTLINEQFKLGESLFEYEEKDVNFRILREILVRGSSRKENIDMD